MNWFTKKPKGVDTQLLIRTRFWDAIEELIETDKQTHAKIVQYMYEQVSDSIVRELKLMEAETDKMTLIQEARSYLAHRIKLLTGYKELAYGNRGDTNSTTTVNPRTASGVAGDSKAQTPQN